MSIIFFRKWVLANQRSGRTKTDTVKLVSCQSDFVNKHIARLIVRGLLKRSPLRGFRLREPPRARFIPGSYYIPVGFHWRRLPSSITLTVVQSISMSTTFCFDEKKTDRNWPGVNSCCSHSCKPVPTSAEGFEREGVGKRKEGLNGVNR